MPFGEKDAMLLVIFAIALAVVIAIATLLGAVILRGAVALYNKLAGRNSAYRVPEPSFAEALQIVFVTTLAQLAAAFFIGQFTETGLVVAAAHRGGIDAGVPLISFVVNQIILIVLLWLMLPTTLGRAIMVTLCYLLIVAIVLGIVVLITIYLLL
jgi:hypothetical protein